MTADLRQLLEQTLVGRTCILGIGNPSWGDDGFGVRLAEELRSSGCEDVIVAGIEPERWISDVAVKRYNNVLLLDALEFPGEPGHTLYMDARQLETRFPQLSTHKLSLGSLAVLIENVSGANVWCLGVKPLSLKGERLSGTVEDTKRLLKALLLGVLGCGGNSGGISGI